VTTTRQRAGRAALLSATLLLASFAAELVYRWSLADAAERPVDDGGWRARYRQMNEALYQRSDDAALIYEPRPNSRVEMEYGPAAFNAAGMRDDRDYARGREEAAGAKTRVALLGDSLVWGEFLALDDAPGRQLERALAESRGDDDAFEILSFGVSGYDTAQEARWYEKAVRPYEPDVLVLVYCMNDMMIMSGPYNRYANEAERRRKEEQDRIFDRVAPLRRETLDRVAREDEEASTLRLLARLRSIFRRLTFDARYVDEYTIMNADRDRVAATEAALARLGAAARHDGARALLVISPVLESWGRYHWREIHDRVTAAGRAAGFTVVDPLSQWRASHDPARLRFPGDNLHYNPRGSALLARRIAAAIEERRP
jgi:lysophospholipase L1-like esterase